MVAFIQGSCVPVARRASGVRLPPVCSAGSHSDSGVGHSKSSLRRPSSSLTGKKRLGLGALGLGGIGWAGCQGWLGRIPDPFKSQVLQALSGRTSDVSSNARELSLDGTKEISPLGSEHGNKSSEVGGLILISGATVIPHPQKVDKGGEDAYFISDNKMSIGVADGVGGWAQVGVDPGEYSEMLMNQAKIFADTQKKYGPDTPKEMLADAHGKTPLPGSSTACIISLDGKKSVVYAANLGDSGFFVFRGGKIVFYTQPQQMSFNTPYQLGFDTSEANKPEQAQDLEIPVKTGDIIVAATDGLWDNMFLEECSRVLRRCEQEGQGPKEMSLGLGMCAEMKSLDKRAVTPFLVNAQQNGIQYMGGKPDDITIVVSRVSQAPSKL